MFKKLFVAVVLSLAPVAIFAQTTTDPVVVAVKANIDDVGVIGGKAYLIGAGLALAGVAIGFIRKAKR